MDQLMLYNGALRICEERRLATLTENREPRRLLDDVWAEDVIKTCLEMAEWNFAVDTQRMDYDPDIEPDFGYRRAFPHPEEFIRMTGLSANETMDPAMTRFRNEGGVIYCDYDIIYMSFVSNSEDFGRNMALWPQSFSKLVMAVLAEEINPRLTTSRVSTETIMGIKKRRLDDAMGKDAVQRPTSFPPQGTFVSARQGYYQSLDTRRRP